DAPAGQVDDRDFAARRLGDQRQELVELTSIVGVVVVRTVVDGAPGGGTVAVVAAHESDLTAALQGTQRETHRRVLTADEPPDAEQRDGPSNVPAADPLHCLTETRATRK